MKNSKIKNESPQSYIEVERVSTARPLCPQDAQLSQLIREHYINVKKRHQESLKENTKEDPLPKDIYSTNYDPLTGLINHDFMAGLLEKSLQLAKDNNEALVILYLSLNHLKQVKDIYGDEIANEALIIVAKRLKLVTRKKDYLSHLYGEQYLVGLRMKKDKLAKTESISKEVTTIISKPMSIQGFKIMIGINISVVAYPMHGDKISVLLNIAEMKMHNMRN